MSFFIKGKTKNLKRKSDGINKDKKFFSKNNKSVRLEKKKHADEEIDSDLEDDLPLKNDYKYSSESEVEETVQEKRLRLARTYLEEIEKEEKERLETEEVEKDIIAQRLKEDVLSKAGRLQRYVGDLYSHCGDHFVFKCKDHSRSITCLVVSNNDEYVYSASDDFNIVKWSLKSRKKDCVVKRTDQNGHKRKILALALCCDNKFLVSGGLEAKINVWNPENLTHLHSFNGHKIDVTGLVFRKNSHQLFSCSSDKTVKVWSLDEMTYVETLYGHFNGITSIDALARERVITSGGRDNTLRIWKIPEESHLILNGCQESIDCVKLLNENYCISGGDGGNICLWSSMRKKPTFIMPEAHGVNPKCNTANWIVSLSTCFYTDFFASGSYNGIINFYKCNKNFRSFEKCMETKVEGNINCMSFTNDGQFLLVGVGQEHRIGRWHDKKLVKNAIVIIPLIKKNL